MWRGNCPTAVFFLLAFAIVLAQDDYPVGTKELASGDEIADAITIKLLPLEKRKKGDLKALVDRFKLLPELLAASIVAASPDLLVLIPTPGQSLAQIRAALLQQPEVYELEVREETYRREGNDKPYEALRKERLVQVLSSTRSRIQDRIRDKLRQLLEGRLKRRRNGGSGDTGGGAVDGVGQGAEEGSTEKQDADATRKAVARAIRRAVKRAARKGKGKGKWAGKAARGGNRKRDGKAGEL